MKKLILIVVLIAVIAFIAFLSMRSEPQVVSPPDEPVAAVAVNLAFVPQDAVTIERYYDQRVTVGLSNRGTVPVRAMVDCESPADLQVGFVGRGSVDWHADQYLELGPGETWPLMLIVHAPDARRDRYTIPLRAHTVAADGKPMQVSQMELEVIVEAPELQLETRWETPDDPTDQARLVRRLVIINRGSRIPDLSVSLDGDLAGDARTSPAVTLAMLASDERLEVRVIPRLYLGFESLAGTVVLRGHNQEVRVPYAVAVPEEQQVFLTVTRSTRRAATEQDRCTNQSSVGSSTGSVPGTSSAGGDLGGLSPAGGGGGVGPMAVAGSGGADEGEEDDDEEEDLMLGSGFGGWGDDDDDDDDAAGNAEDAVDAAEREAEANRDLADRARNITEGTTGTTPSSAFGASELDIDDFMDRLRESGASGQIPDPALGGIVMKWVGANPGIIPGDGTNWGEAVDYLTADAGQQAARKVFDHHLLEGCGYPPAEPNSPPFAPVRPVFLAPEATTRELVVHRDGDQVGTLVSRTTGGRSTASYIPVGIVGSRTLRAPVALRTGGRRIQNPTVGRGPSGQPMAAFARNTATGTEIVVEEPGTDRHLVLGDGTAIARRPVIVPAADAAASDVVWLEGDRVRTARVGADFTEPEVRTLAEDVDTAAALQARRAPDGTVAVMYRSTSGELRLDRGDGETTAIPGSSGDFILDGDGQPLVAYRTADGQVRARDPQGRETAMVPRDWRTTTPVLVAKEDGGSRFIVHRHFRHTPDTELPGSWYRDYQDGEWSELRPLGRPEEPVTGAAIAVNASLPWNKAAMKRMDIRYVLNGREIGSTKGRIPEGRYVFPVPPEVIRTSIQDSRWPSRQNDLHMTITGIGKGEFHVVDTIELYTRHAIIQDYLVAPTQDEAQQLATRTTPEVRHQVPDLLLTSDDWEPPQDARPGQQLTAVIGLVNLGDRDVPAGTLVARAGDTIIGQSTYPALRPFTRRRARIDLTLPDWDPWQAVVMSISSDVAGDPEPANNRVRFGIFGTPAPGLLGPSQPVGIAIATLRDLPTLDLSRPVEIPLQGARSRWFKVQVPGSGELQAEINPVPEDLSIVLDLFDADGKVMAQEGGARLATGDILYVRLGLRPGSTLPRETAIKFWWETP